jgi:hypothetical protein
MKVERNQRTLASASSGISQFVAARRVSAATELTRDETGTHHHKPGPDEEDDAPSPAHHAANEDGTRLLNITA